MTITATNARPRLWQRMLRAVLPGDNTFWRIYAPVINILRDSKEHQIIRERMNQALNLTTSDKVLDLGCGKGIWAGQVLPQVSSVTAVDNEERMLSYARLIFPGVSFMQMDLNQHLPFSNASFTKAGSLLLEGYIHDRDLLHRESFRVLDNGGILAVVTPKKGASFFKVLMAEARRRKEEHITDEGNFKKLVLGATASLIFGKMAELKAKAGDWHFYEKDELIEAYQAAGFNVLSCDLVYAQQAWLLIAQKPA